MKKIAILFVLLALLMLVACKDEPAENVNENENEENIEESFYNTEEEVIFCYFSLLTEDGFGNYLLAFPEEFRKGYQKDIGLENDSETFDQVIENATYTLHVTRDTQYDGAEYHIEYELDSKIEMTDKEKEALLSDLEDYCHMTLSTIEKVELHRYNVSEYGIDVEGNIINEQNAVEDINMLYITGEGWCVSPNEFELP